MLGLGWARSWVLGLSAGLGLRSLVLGWLGWAGLGLRLGVLGARSWAGLAGGARSSSIYRGVLGWLGAGGLCPEIPMTL